MSQSIGRIAPAVPEMAFYTDPGTKPMTVLLVEDEETLRAPVAKLLRRRGFVVLETGDGGSAIDLYRAKAGEIDVVLLDMTLPSMSGGDVLAELMAIRADTKVVLTSGYDQETVMRTLGGQRPWAYFRKPYSPSELADFLRSATLPASGAPQKHL